MPTTHVFEAVELTHVRYQKGDSLGHFLAWFSLVPIFISVSGFISRFIIRRKLQGIFFSLSHTISFYIMLVSSKCQSNKRDPRHVSCWRCAWLALKPLPFRVLLCHISISLGLQRYWGYHTIGQVLDGAFFGVFMGGLWFWVVNFVFSPYFAAIEESLIGRMLFIKNTSHLEQMLKFEYQNARASRKATTFESYIAWPIIYNKKLYPTLQI